MRRGRVVATVAVGGLLFYGAFLALVTPRVVESADPAQAIGYSLVPDKDAAVSRAHLVTASAWSHRTSAPVAVTLHYREGLDGAFHEVRMQRVGARSFAAELPPRAAGERDFYYLAVRDALGNEANVPGSAPDAPLLHVRWEAHVDPAVLALHISLMIGAVFFLLHAMHFSLPLLSSKGPTARAGKVHRGIRWGWLCFFLGGIPLGIYVSGTALGWGNAWGAWPLGADITDTKTELLALYWAVVLALRPDLWPRLGRVGRAGVSDKTLGILVLAGAALTVVVYAIPHSLFFQ